ncbi:hypothetical protein Tco_0617545 [Tanacetum coccineum]
MILHDGNERLILNMRHDTSSYSNEPHQESINMIDVYNVSFEEILKYLFAINHISGNPTSSSHPDLTSPEVNDDIFDPEEDIIENLLNLDKTKDLPPYHDNPLNIKYLLNHDPIKEMDYIFEDSVDKNSPHDNLVDTISEMFTNEHTLDYSSPPLWDDYEDELSDLKTVNDNTYDDPFDFKEEKIKDSKILIDELDLPGSSDSLPSPECDSVFYMDFSEVDALSSTNNEDKDFNPPLYELFFHKEVLGLGALLSFSSENEEKVFNPEILTSKGVHTSLLPELSHRGTKAFKVIKIFESPIEIFPCSYGEDIRILDVSCLHFYPP